MTGRVALTLRWLSDANRELGLYEEGIQQAKEALEIYERLGDTVGTSTVFGPPRLVVAFGRTALDAAEEAASRAIDLLPEKGQEFLVCRISSHSW
jgi:hypothetical protein